MIPWHLEVLPRNAVLVCGVFFLCPQGGRAEFVVPGYVVETYAEVADPIELAFDSLGNLFVGRDNSGSGGSQVGPAKIHRIAPDGTVTEWGAEALSDPDVVAVDTSGAITGTPNSVLVGQRVSTTTGRVRFIKPDQSISVLFSTTQFNNIAGFGFDSSGSLLVQGLFTPDILRYDTNATLTVLVEQSGRGVNLQTDGAGLIYSATGSPGTYDGRVRIFSEAGVLVDDAYLTGLDGFRSNFNYLGQSPWGSGLLGVHSNGELAHYDLTGAKTSIGTGFSQTPSVVLGPDGAYYLSDFTNDRVLRVAPVPEPDSLLVLLSLWVLTIIRRGRRDR